MKQVVISEEILGKALFEIIGAYKLLCKIEKSGMPDNRIRARDAATLIEIGIRELLPLTSGNIVEIVTKEISSRQISL